jgi:homoserine O-succinyltransferase
MIYWPILNRHFVESENKEAMPVNVPDQLPAIDILKKENIFILNQTRACHQDIRPLRILILNLMPNKINTEVDLLRLLSNSPLQIEVDFLKITGHFSKNTPEAHMKAFYKHFREIGKRKYDGMIITGAPVELLPYEEVRYWDEFRKILDWSQDHVFSTMFICWAAQAGLYHFWGIPKYMLPAKISGVFPHSFEDEKLPIFRGFDDVFWVPQSRYSEIRRADIEKVTGLTVLSSSAESGIYMVSARGGRQLFITGHPEYSRYTLDWEFRRDIAGSIQARIPVNYYPDNNLNRMPVMLWRSASNLFFSNWLNYCVYQETPYNLDAVGKE